MTYEEKIALFQAKLAAADEDLALAMESDGCMIIGTIAGNVELLLKDDGTFMVKETLGMSDFRVPGGIVDGRPRASNIICEGAYDEMRGMLAALYKVG